jgi:aminoglycoside phosphotransferase (APT) family kinase protein
MTVPAWSMTILTPDALMRNFPVALDFPVAAFSLLQPMTNDRWIKQLAADPLVGGAAMEVTPLPGGVSSDIYLVQTADRRFVVKAALPKLRVSADWHADISRNAVEKSYLEYAGTIVPGAVPRVLGGSAEAGWFAMEFVDQGFENWKQRLLAGDANPAHARLAGEILGRLHRASMNDPGVRSRFATWENFRALRIDPYLLATAERVPAARAALRAEAERLAGTQLALVHGDFSPKNLLVGANRLMVLDAECGWFGDPAFDTAFLINHFVLKALFHADKPQRLLALIPEFWLAYAAVMEPADPQLERRTVRLVLCLMLARVHGKSPVEYLPQPAQKTAVTDFVLSRLTQPPESVAELASAWGAQLALL